MNKIIVVLILVFGLSSCTVLKSIYDFGADNISVTWKKSEGKTVIDSLLIQNTSAYHILKCDTLDYEKDFELNGYNVWILKIDNKIRFEVKKKDSLIYLYGK